MCVYQEERLKHKKTKSAHLIILEKVNDKKGMVIKEKRTICQWTYVEINMSASFTKEKKYVHAKGYSKYKNLQKKSIFFLLWVSWISFYCCSK